MKKILALMACLLIFVACDFARESMKVKPDIEITYINPLGAYIDVSLQRGDTVAIKEIHFVAKNSVDCTTDRMIIEYYSSDGTSRFFGPVNIPIYVKIKGITDPKDVDTTKIENIPLPIDTVIGYMLNPNSPSIDAKAVLQFVAYDDYGEGTCDTATCWFGFYRSP